MHTLEVLDKMHRIDSIVKYKEFEKGLQETKRH
jgi:hypothetical protein